MFCLSPFLKLGTMFPFFYSSRNIPHFKEFLNILKRGSIIASPDTFNMRILIISWPWALLGSSLQMIHLISSFVNSMFDRYWSVMVLVDEGRTLLFSITEHCFAKKQLKKLAFLWKYVTSLLSRRISRIQGTFQSFNIMQWSIIF